jgi:hypothetical protein
LAFSTNLLVAGCLSILLSTSGPAAAQDTAPEVDLQPLPQQVSAEFDQTLAEIEEQKEDIKHMERRLADFEGVSAEILGGRRDDMWAAAFNKTLKLARSIAAQEQRGGDVAATTDADSEEQAGATDATVGLNESVTVYQMTKKGLALQATLQGTKYWKDDDLN